MAGNILVPRIIGVTPGEGTVECVPGIPADKGAIGRMACGFEKKSPEILLDFGRKVTGYLEIFTQGHSGDSFKIRYGPTADCLHMRQRIQMPACGRLGEQYLGEFYVACRYIAISIDTDSLQRQDVFANVQSVRLLTSQYPVSCVGHFSCEDEGLNTVWRRGARTQELCMQQYRESCRYRVQNLEPHLAAYCENWKGPYGTYVMLEGARRDREVWLGDARAQALLTYTAFGAYDVVKNTLALFRDLARQDGSVAASGFYRQCFDEYDFWGVMAVWDCYLYTGDRAFLEQALPVVRNVLNYTVDRLDERGFFANDASWMWTIPREGYNAGTQAILYAALGSAARIERAMHFPEEAKRWETLREKIADNLNQTFWNEELGVYDEVLRITTDRKPVLQDLNCYAVLFGLADEEKSGRILHYLRENMWTEVGSATFDHKLTHPVLEDGLRFWPLTHVVKAAPNPVAEMERFIWLHNRKVWPFMNGYEVEARFRAGDTEGALELIHRCWDQPHFDETDTFWEFVDPENPVLDCGSCYYIPKDDCYNSAAHGWSGWVSYLMQTYLLGIKPMKPGFSVTTVCPQSGLLCHLTGTVPTPLGAVTVTIEKNAETYALTVEKPMSMEVRPEVEEAEAAGRRVEITVIDREDEDE